MLNKEIRDGRPQRAIDTERTIRKFCNHLLSRPPPAPTPVLPRMEAIGCRPWVKVCEIVSFSSVCIPERKGCRVLSWGCTRIGCAEGCATTGSILGRHQISPRSPNAHTAQQASAVRGHGEIATGQRTWLPRIVPPSQHPRVRGSGMATPLLAGWPRSLLLPLPPLWGQHVWSSLPRLSQDVWPWLALYPQWEQQHQHPHPRLALPSIP
ncbi:hypothetical protein GQ53DRAFT_333644 [Thozetella sp. PMI_491]|nr:hypothetical protein GQ53DRAFT_333644 [Thozetella sp. PMI_491]